MYIHKQSYIYKPKYTYPFKSSFQWPLEIRFYWWIKTLLKLLATDSQPSIFENIIYIHLVTGCLSCATWNLLQTYGEACCWSWCNTQTSTWAIFEAAAAKPIETEVEPLTDGLAPELAKAPFNMIPLVERLDRNTEGSSPENWLFVLDFERNTYGAEPFCVVCLGNAFSRVPLIVYILWYYLY